MLENLKHRVWWISGGLVLLSCIPLIAYALEQPNKVPEIQLKIEKQLTVQELIIKYSEEYNIPSKLTLTIAKCESGFKPTAQNKTSTASGIFQFLNGTWIQTRTQMGLDTSLELKMNAEENIKTAMWKIANGGLRAWDASKSCWGNWNYEAQSNISNK